MRSVFPACAEGTVLVIDDEPSICQVLDAALRLRGFEVYLATGGEAGLQLASALEPDVVILDLGLPDLDGIEVCQRLRQWSSNPILVLTVDDGEDRKIEALDAGADDYVSKPFSMPELLARVRVASRHRRALALATEPGVVAVGRITLDTGAHEMRIDATVVPLAHKEFAVLAVLARNAGRVTPHRVLLTAVWGPSHSSVELIRGQINQLRRKLDPASARVRIENEPGIGYRLVALDEG